MILVSACLAGFDCKYNGGNNVDDTIVQLVKEGKAIPVCPEELGGLTTPRAPSEVTMMQQKRCVVNTEGQDVTAPFVLGAQKCFAIAKRYDCQQAILQPRSPSCGKGKIYNGKFEKVLVDGNGVFAELLLQNGITVFTLDEWKEKNS